MKKSFLGQLKGLAIDGIFVAISFAAGYMICTAVVNEQFGKLWTAYIEVNFVDPKDKLNEYRGLVLLLPYCEDSTLNNKNLKVTVEELRFLLQNDTSVSSVRGYECKADYRYKWFYEE